MYRNLLACKASALEAGIEAEWWAQQQVQAQMQSGIDKGMFGSIAGKGVAGLNVGKVLPPLVWQYNVNMILRVYTDKK